MLPAVPCETPILAPRSRVGHGAIPGAAAGFAAGEGLAPAELTAAVAAGVAEVAVAGAVVAGPADGLEVSQPAAKAAMQVKAAPAIARRVIRGDAVIASVSFCPGRLLHEPCDRYDAGRAAVVGLDGTGFVTVWPRPSGDRHSGRCPRAIAPPG